jgi:hypothetical protein
MRWLLPMLDQVVLIQRSVVVKVVASLRGTAVEGKTTMSGTLVTDVLVALPAVVLGQG